MRRNVWKCPYEKLVNINELDIGICGTWCAYEKLVNIHENTLSD